AQMRKAADAASLAAVLVLRDTGSVSQARQAAQRFASLNSVGGRPVELDANRDVIFGRRVYNQRTGRWEFQRGEEPYDSVQVVVSRTASSRSGPLPTYFGRVLGRDHLEAVGSSVATFLPRDIALVIDLSGSMLYDSTLLREDITTINNMDIWIALGRPRYGRMQSWNRLQRLTGGTSSIIRRLGLNNVDYPYPQGSWSEYVRYVKYDWRLPWRYRHRYGLKTWVDYLLQKRSYHRSTPALASTPEQPVTALKDAVDIMMDYLETLDTEEYVSLSTYDDRARIELSLRTELSDIKTRMRQLQAGHYGRYTNIGLGIRRGRQSLTSADARPNAKKVMVVFTDGLANRPPPSSYARRFALREAQEAAAQDIVIHTITFTSQADQQLMRQIADIGNGVHFHVPSYDVEQYRQDLTSVLLTISSMRPVLLVQ
ncbi:MAG TPA: VWA domain-containing protein, partial [Planctomycetaceae bacterium]|nr:VWA domain-containing protein [Planctomycetaceae bacterium]